MYAIVVMATMSTNMAEPAFCWRRHCCYTACYSCGSWGCHGCHGFTRASWCHGCYTGYRVGYGCHLSYYGCYGCYGCYAYSSGCYCSFGNIPSSYHVLPTPPPAEKKGSAEKIGPPKELPKDEKKEEEKKLQARLIVEVPENARLYIDGQLMKSQSKVRVFRTPTLDQNEAYFYDLRAEIDVDGKIEAETKRVIIRAGREIHASFPKLMTIAVAGK
ncbi:MAG: hypothetical protein KatS3mg105_0994 [Gemmatales bacterium]|nr:MAG: hypothetical protein KatS3mg105_0994 [Gemmatales bacterium]